MARTFTANPTASDQPVEFETVKLTSGGVGIKSPVTADLLDPCFVSVSNLIRMPQSEVEALYAWVASERARLAARGAAAEESGREAAAALKTELEGQAAGRRAWL